MTQSSYSARPRAQASEHEVDINQSTHQATGTTFFTKRLRSFNTIRFMLLCVLIVLFGVLGLHWAALLACVLIIEIPAHLYLSRQLNPGNSSAVNDKTKPSAHAALSRPADETPGPVATSMKAEADQMLSEHVTLARDESQQSMPESVLELTPLAIKSEAPIDVEQLKQNTQQLNDQEIRDALFGRWTWNLTGAGMAVEGWNEYYSNGRFESKLKLKGDDRQGYCQLRGSWYLQDKILYTEIKESSDAALVPTGLELSDQLVAISDHVLICQDEYGNLNQERRLSS